MGGLSGPVSDSVAADCSWSEARLAAKAYLTGLGVDAPAAVDPILDRLMITARDRARQHGDRRAPRAILCTLLLEALLDWFREVLQPDATESEAELLQRGRMALLMADLTFEKQMLFLRPLEPDHAFAAELKRLHDLSGPEAAFAEMRSEPLDLGALPRLADNALSELDRAPRLRFSLLWLIALAFFGTLFYLTR